MPSPYEPWDWWLAVYWCRAGFHLGSLALKPPGFVVALNSEEMGRVGRRGDRDEEATAIWWSAKMDLRQRGWPCKGGRGCYRVSPPQHPTSSHPVKNILGSSQCGHWERPKPSPLKALVGSSPVTGHWALSSLWVTLGKGLGDSRGERPPVFKATRGQGRAMPVSWKIMSFQLSLNEWLHSFIHLLLPHHGSLAH